MPEATEPARGRSTAENSMAFMSIGYVYQHRGTANIGANTPGTDTQTFYAAVSRFRTKGCR
jgi:hypothetical protein